VDVAKHQDGETGCVEFWFHRNYFLFEEAPEGSFDAQAPKDEKQRGRKDEAGEYGGAARKRPARGEEKRTAWREDLALEDRE
jgi:hypothetical protein